MRQPNQIRTNRTVTLPDYLWDRIDATGQPRGRVIERALCETGSIDGATLGAFLLTLLGDVETDQLRELADSLDAVRNLELDAGLRLAESVRRLVAGAGDDAKEKAARLILGRPSV